MTASNAVLAQLVTRIESLSIENLKMRTFILSLPEAETDGFSWQDLLSENEPFGGIGPDVHSLADEVREQIHESDDPSLALETFLQALSTLTL
jgi:hypothetical protein